MSDGWIKADGRNCPVKKGTLVDIKRRNGEMLIGVRSIGPEFAHQSSWHHDQAYRLEDIMEWRYSIDIPPALPKSPPTPRIAAHEFLERGVKHMRDRAVQRDSDAGERSMARAVAAFNAQEGTNLTKAQGWRFMIQLKYSRSVHGVFVADDYEDMAAYAGLAGEAAQ